MSLSEVETLIEQELASLPGWCTVEKGKRMAQLSYGASLCVELGVFGGRGLVSMALALADQGFGRADGIDPYEASSALEGTNDPANNEWWEKNVDYQEIARVAQVKLCELGVFHCTRLVRMPSRYAAPYYADESIDVLHQDSNHSEEISTEEVTLWAPKIRPGGIWVFDDSNWPTTQNAQRVLVSLGFEETENHDFWKVYRKL